MTLAAQNYHCALCNCMRVPTVCTIQKSSLSRILEKSMGIICRGDNFSLADWKMIRPRSPRPSRLDREDQAFNNNDGQDKQTNIALSPSRKKTVSCDQVEYSLDLTIKAFFWVSALNILTIPNNLSPGLRISLFCDEMIIFPQLHTIYSRRSDPLAAQVPKQGYCITQCIWVTCVEDPPMENVWKN